MTSEVFNKIIGEQIDICTAMLIRKSKEYATEKDRLLSFHTAAELQQCTPREALAGMMAKHTHSVYDLCKNGSDSLELWTEKITDHINYLLLLKAVVLDERLMNFSITPAPQKALLTAQEMQMKLADLHISGQRLRAWRENAGLNQVELAQKLNVHRTLVSKWELGTQSITHYWYPFILQLLQPDEYTRRLQNE